MSAFFRFPRTPHLAWLGPGSPRDDKLLAPDEAEALLAGEVIVEEKIDGANLGLSVGDDGRVRAQNRGKYLELGALPPQFAPLGRWLAPREEALVRALGSELIVFGEWCYAMHSVEYTRLPDWFVAFDVYDLRAARFWSVARRNALTSALGLAVVPLVARGHFDLDSLRALFGPSAVSDGPSEGLYIRREEGDHLLARAKLVRPEFVQQIDAHWSKRALRTNRLASPAP